MRAQPGTVLLSPSDLRAAAECAFAWVHSLDVRAGLAAAGPEPADPMLARAAELGTAHEAAVLARLTAEYGPYDPVTGSGVYRLARPDGSDGARRLAAAETLATLRDGADVVYQGVIATDSFVGYPDFLVHRPDGTWAVHDAKLARTARVTALLQIAAYAAELMELGVPVADTGYLELGSGRRTAHRLDEIIPVYRTQAALLRETAARHLASGRPVAWGAEGVAICGRCAVCTAEIERTRDVLLVAGLTRAQRNLLRAAHITTIDALAARDEPVAGIARRTWATLSAQARLQVGAGVGAGGATATGEGTAAGHGVIPSVRYETIDAASLAALPAPSAGDLFFDFEGDPLYRGDDPAESGLEYLFGFVEAPREAGDEPAFTALWAHDRAGERQALVDFLALVRGRRERYPDMHIYHYAAYEKSTLTRLAARYGVGEEEVDGLLRDGVLVDLYPIVRRAVRVSQPSYSIKKLEPLYMGGELRTGDVVAADESVVAYARYCALRDAGKQREAAHVLAGIADYNRYDCVSTLRLRDWLLAIAANYDVSTGGSGSANGIASTGDADDTGGQAATDPGRAGDAAIDDAAAEAAELVSWLTAGSAHLPRPERSAAQQARAILAAAIDYHRREEKPVWWAHFDRLTSPVDEWAGTSGVMVVDAVEVLADWAVSGRQRTAHRRLRVRGDLGGGKDLDSSVFLLYEPGAGPIGIDDDAGRRGSTSGTVTWRDPDDPGLVEVDESGPGPDTAGPALPIAITPGAPVRTHSLRDAVREVARTTLAYDAAGASEADTAGAGGDRGAARPVVMDLLERVPLDGDRPADADAPGPHARQYPPSVIDRAVTALTRSRRTYLAIQGPPGSGKTFNGGRIVAALADRGWRIGVVAQSHRVVENFLAAVAGAGVPADRIGKSAEGSDADRDRAATGGWTMVPKRQVPAWLAGHEGSGCIVGGTAWDFTNERRIARASLDLLVVDEAGQFSLANTIAVSVAARRLLLLGDPQQLPQVSQGTHPEPCDASALSHLIGGQAVLPAEYGLFLAETWRMHPALCAKVSRLSYDGRLTSHEAVTAARRLTGIEPGIEVVPVDHEGNAARSPEEAAEVVRQVRRFLGAEWCAPDDGTGRPRRLGEADVLVVAAFNAQVSEIRRALDANGLTAVRVGTVDKFQGQQAPVAIVSMAASDAAEVPRGMEFLLNRHRINVAISRAQWITVIVRSPQLTTHLPAGERELTDLGAFLTLCER